MPEGATVVGTMQGSWLSHLDIDGQRIWSLADETPLPWTAAEHPLPSDTRYRQDLAAVLKGDLKQAQVGAWGRS